MLIVAARVLVKAACELIVADGVLIIAARELIVAARTISTQAAENMHTSSCDKHASAQKHSSARA